MALNTTNQTKPMAIKLTAMIYITCHHIQMAMAVADLEGACGACAPLKFAKQMLYNIN